MADTCQDRFSLGGCNAGVVFSFETVEILIRFKIFSVVLANVLALMISLLLFCVPEWLISVCIPILNADFIGNLAFIYLDFHAFDTIF